MTHVEIEIIGHSLEVIGAFGFGYELLRGYPQRNRRQIAEVKLDGLLRFIKEMEQRIEQLPPIYTPAEKDEQKRELHHEWDPRIKLLQDEIQKRGEGHEVASFYFGLLGALCLIV